MLYKLFRRCKKTITHPVTYCSIGMFLLVVLVTIIFTTLAFYIFYKGLKRYSSSNLMIARI